MNRRLRRWISILVLGTLGFAQASLVMAACSMDRANLAQMLAGPSHECCDESVPMSTTSCLSQSTADLQAVGATSDLVALPVAMAVLFRAPEGAPPVAQRIAVPPHKAVPPRILLHSFLI